MGRLKVSRDHGTHLNASDCDGDSRSVHACEDAREHGNAFPLTTRLANSIHQRILQARECRNGQALPGHTRPLTVASEEFA